MLPGAIAPVAEPMIHEATSGVIVLEAIVTATAIAAPLPPACARALRAAPTAASRA
jgi:hypothetical protein